MAGSESDSSPSAGKDEVSSSAEPAPTDKPDSGQAESSEPAPADKPDSGQSESSEPVPADKADTSPTDKPDAGQASEPGQDQPGAEPSAPLHQHHVSKILDEALEDTADETPSGRRLRCPLLLDFCLGLGLLVATAGFTIGLFKMYLIHSADQSIAQHNYKAAIALLKGSPLPTFFNISGPDAEELLSQALYLDAMEKIDIDNDTDGAMKELSQIRPGSRYFSLAQEILSDNFIPSATTLQGSAEQVETNPPPPRKKSPLDEPADND